VGTYGAITVKPTKAGSQQAVCRVRDPDGVTRKVTATAKTKRAATDLLVEKIKERHRAYGGELTASSRMADLAQTWLNQLDPAEVSESCGEAYAGTVLRHVIPKIGELRINEFKTSRADAFLESVATKHQGAHTKADGTPIMIGGPTAAKTARIVLTGMMGLAVRYDLIDVNPVREARTPTAPRTPVRALTADELQDLINHITEWAQGGTYGPQRDQDVLDMLDVMIGTGARPGEVLALRFSDGVSLAGEPSVSITGTVKRTKAKGLHRQDYPKTQGSERELRVPEFVAAVLRRRRLRSGGIDWVFPNRDGGLREPANLNRVWRSARGEKWAWVTPKSFRAAVATIIDREADSQHAASQLGHTSDAVTRKHYIERDKRAADNSAILERFREAK